MKCPKCQYISFDRGERCRNCGYDFSLSEDRTPIDLPISSPNEPLGPLADFDLGVPARGNLDIAAVGAVTDSSTRDKTSGARPAGLANTDLPLFTNPSDDAPL